MAATESNSEVLEAPTSEAVRVICRFRPVNDRERSQFRVGGRGEDAVPCSVQDDTVIIKNDTERPYRFAFDNVLWHDVDQHETFERVAGPVCRNALNGFNGTVFAYGQTGSGKTHTMLGPEGNRDPSQSGLVPRAANFFFHHIENSLEIESAELRVSFLEIYNGELRDLNPKDSSRTGLRIRQRVSGETFVENLNTTSVRSLAQVLKLVAQANGNRTMAATLMNHTSSRSHLIMTFHLKIKKTPEAGGHKMRAKVNFIDLAGSEKIKKTHATGSRLVEAKAINQGLSTLARAIEAIVKKRRSVPFRDSLLTWILKDSLVGNTKTTLIVTVSPHVYNREETITTCRFAGRCKLIKTRVVSNKEMSPQQMKALIKKLRGENSTLRDQVENGLVSGGSVPKEMETDFLQYKLQAQARAREIKELTDQLRTMRDREAEMDARLQEAEAQAAECIDHEQQIESLSIEVERLQKLLDDANQQKTNLAVMNALLADQLDMAKGDAQTAGQRAEKHERLAALAHAQKDELSGENRDLLSKLRELEFTSDEARQIHDSVLEEMTELTSILDANDEELEMLRNQVADQEVALESKENELRHLRKKITALEERRPVSRASSGTSTPKFHATGFTLRQEDLDQMESYLQGLQQEEEKDWEAMREQAWAKFLDDKAREQNFRSGDELLASRRAEAKRNKRRGQKMPSDAMLLADIREEFESRYDPVTGRLRDLVEEDNVRDDNDVDDPMEWGLPEVSDWLRSIGMEKYLPQFERENVDGRMLLLDVTGKNLQTDLGVGTIHIQKILREIRVLRERSPLYEEISGMEQKQFDMGRVDDEADVANAGMDIFDMTDEKEDGEVFWGFDEVFKILDLRETGDLDLVAFKHGLIALGVQLTNEEMNATFNQIDKDRTGTITYKTFAAYLSTSDALPDQRRQYAEDILDSLPRVAKTRRRFVVRGAIVIKYALRQNKRKIEIFNFLLNKGLSRPEINAAWKQYLFNPRAIPDMVDGIDFAGSKRPEGAIVNEQAILPFDDFQLYKLLKRAGNKGVDSTEFNDLDDLRAAGYGCRVAEITAWVDLESDILNGIQVVYECVNGQIITADKHFSTYGRPTPQTMNLNGNEIIETITVYIGHFVAGLLITTNSKSQLLGKDNVPKRYDLVAPSGGCIMALYGSHAKPLREEDNLGLIESLGCYVTLVPERAGRVGAFGGRGIGARQQTRPNVRETRVEEDTAWTRFKKRFSTTNV